MGENGEKSNGKGIGEKHNQNQNACEVKPKGTPKKPSDPTDVAVDADYVLQKIVSLVNGKTAAKMDGEKIKILKKVFEKLPDQRKMKLAELKDVVKNLDSEIRELQREQEQVNAGKKNERSKTSNSDAASASNSKNINGSLPH